jgi:hypothetical protein
VSCPLLAIHATSHRRNKLRIALVEGCEFEDEEDVALNPELEIADGEKNAFGLQSSRAPVLFEASGECQFLLLGLPMRVRWIMRE